MQCNPIVIDGIMYGVSANTQAFSVDAAIGKERWKTNLPDTEGTTSRGVTYWTDGTNGRIYFGVGNWLYALNTKSGAVIDEFGQNGRINLLDGITRPGADQYVRSNTPNTIYKNLLIVGARVSEGETALLGDIRAYDVHTGRKVWTFHTIPQPGEPGYSTWSPANPRGRLGGANAWAGMAIDRALTAIDLNTGEHRWQVPLGEYPELPAKGIAPTGTDNHGGPLVTGSGLLFIAASKDRQLRALDKKTGKIIWQSQLPTAGYASPATYSVGGKQFIVIACGGGKLKSTSGDQYVAYALGE